MPFSKTTDVHTEEYWTRHFADYLKPLVEECPNLKARRSEALRGDILKQIITDLIVSQVVVADLTDANPNVYWELGIRQSFKHCTITIAEDGTRIPFNLSMKGHLFYHPEDHIKDAEFRRKFKSAIMDCINYPQKPDSHILETITGRGTLFEIFREDETKRRVAALISENQENKRILAHIYTTIEENKKRKLGELSGVGSRMQSFAIQLLVINRYLDKDDSFYRFFIRLLGNIATINSELEQWLRSPEPAQKWFLDNRSWHEQEFTECEKNLSDLSLEINARSSCS
jgi:hypothetical protein